jgi:hypothetical protein
MGLTLVAAAVAIRVESIYEILTQRELSASCTLVVLAGVLIVNELCLARTVGRSILRIRRIIRGSTRRNAGNIVVLGMPLPAGKVTIH